MFEIDAIHTFEDKAFLHGISRMSVAVVLAGAALGVAWFASGAPERLGLPGQEFVRVVVEGQGFLGPLPSGTVWLAAGVIGCFASLGVHELVHGIFFKLFAPAGSKVKFGANLKAGMLYASVDGAIYTRRQYLIISLAPTVIVTAFLLALGVAVGWPLLGYGLAVIHLSGCTGDWGYAKRILSDPRIVYCEDTSWGVKFFAEGAAGGAMGAGPASGKGNDRS